MTKRPLVSAAAGALALASFAAAVTPASADWRHHRRGWNPGAAAAVGLLGGVAVGAAIASSARAAPVYVEEPAPRGVYAAEAPAEECVVERRRVWVPGWGWEMRRRTVCE